MRKNIGLNQVYYDQFLSDYAFGVLGNPEEDYVSGKFVPLTPVGKPSGKYRVFDQKTRAQMETAKALVRAPHEEVSTSDFDWASDNYNTEEYAHGTHLAPEELAAADQRAFLEMAKVRYVMSVVRQKHEIKFCDSYFKAGVWGSAGSTDLTFGTAANPVFDDYTASDPIAQIAKIREDGRKTSGKWFNRALIGPAVWRAIMNHPAIKNVMAVTSNRIPTTALVAQILGLESITVAGATKATSVEGAAASAATFDFIFGRHMLIGYFAQNNQPEGVDASAARIFSFNGQNGAGAPNQSLLFPIERIPRPLNGDERIQTKANWGHKITGPYLAVFCSGVVSASF